MIHSKPHEMNRGNAQWFGWTHNSHRNHQGNLKFNFIFTAANISKMRLNCCVAIFFCSSSRLDESETNTEKCFCFFWFNLCFADFFPLALFFQCKTTNIIMAATAHTHSHSNEKKGVYFRLVICYAAMCHMDTCCC